MKTIIFLIFGCLMINNIFGQATTGTQVTATLVPNDLSDDYPTHSDIYGFGGYRIVADSVERLAIKTSYRKIGMLVKQQSNDSTYTLKGGTSNVYWKKVNESDPVYKAEKSTLATIAYVDAKIGSLNKSITANSSSITTTTETAILSSNQITANLLQPGTIIKITLSGTCTATANMVPTFYVRIGTSGTVSDGLLGTFALATSAKTGTTIRFNTEINITILTVGTASTSNSDLVLINGGTTGISSTLAQVITGTSTTFNNTVNNYLTVSYKNSVTGNTVIFNQCFIDFVKL